MPLADSRRLCTCSICSAINPEGSHISRSTYFLHKANQKPRPISSSSKFRRHRKKAGVTAPNELPQPSFVDSLPSPHSAGQPASVQLPDTYTTPTRRQVGDTDDAIGDAMNDALDDALDEDGTDEYAHLFIDWQTGSTEEEFGTEMQDDETLEQLSSTLDAILIEDKANELDSNSDDDAMSDMCPHCNEPRYSPASRPRKQFLYVPVARRLVLQYSDAGRARVYRQERVIAVQQGQHTWIPVEQIRGLIGLIKEGEARFYMIIFDEYLF
jgi:hypothetical protein